MNFLGPTLQTGLDLPLNAVVYMSTYSIHYDVSISGESKVTQQAASYGEIRESKETARDEEIWEKGMNQKC